jgi:hypothetical protein
MRKITETTGERGPLVLRTDWQRRLASPPREPIREREILQTEIHVNLEGV